MFNFLSEIPTNSIHMNAQKAQQTSIHIIDSDQDYGEKEIAKLEIASVNNCFATFKQFSWAYLMGLLIKILTSCSST